MIDRKNLKADAETAHLRINLLIWHTLLNSIVIGGVIIYLVYKG